MDLFKDDIIVREDNEQDKQYLKLKAEREHLKQCNYNLTHENKKLNKKCENYQLMNESLDRVLETVKKELEKYKTIINAVEAVLGRKILDK